MKLSKYALLVASGLMVSAGAMAGQTVSSGGTGTVNIAGTIRNATCSIDMPSKSVDFELSKVDINKAAPKAELITLPLNISVKNCANQKLSFSAISNLRDTTNTIMGYFDTAGDSKHSLGFFVGVKSAAEVSGGYPTLSKGTNLVDLSGSDVAPVMLLSTNADTTYTLNNIIVKNIGDANTITGNKVAATYNYTFTY
ncbi:type 1 fimbrial protein, partial [Salmonella enterica]|nr:type 1 fimbrial protein [Salmonella enterica]